MVDEITEVKKSLKNLNTWSYILGACYLFEQGQLLFLPKDSNYQLGTSVVLILLFVTVIHVRLVCEKIIAIIEKNKDI